MIKTIREYRMRIVLLISMFMLVVPAAWAVESAKPVVQVAFMQFPGHAEPGQDGQPVGRTVSLVRLLLEQAGYPYELRILPAARVFVGLQDGAVHLWPGLLNKPDLAPYTLKTERDLTQVRINLYHRPGTLPPVWPDSLQGSSLILITNYTYTDRLRRIMEDPALNLTIHRSASHQGAISMLLLGRADYLLEYRSQVEPLLSDFALDELPHIAVDNQPMRLVLSRQTWFAEQLRKDLDRAYDELKAQGVELDPTRLQD